jgi:hypothetical protein
MSPTIKYNEFGEVMSVNGITTGHHLGTPMQDAIGTPEENSSYGTEIATVSRSIYVVEDKQPDSSGEPVVDVPELPEENIDPDVVYKVVNKPDNTSSVIYGIPNEEGIKTVFEHKGENGWVELNPGGGKDPILGELIVTENGVYDEPMIGGELDFSVGKTVQFKDLYTLEDFPTDYYPVDGEEYKDNNIDTKDLAMGIGVTIFNNGGIMVQILVFESLEKVQLFRYVNDLLIEAQDVGVTKAGWYQATSDGDVKLNEPWSCTIESETEAEVYSNAPFLFSAPSTPADGWNKVTINVAGDIIDVPELPTENIEEGKIYRVTSGDNGTYGIPNANPVKRLVDGAWVDLA